MQPRRLIARGLIYYWRTNVAVVFGVATAVAVLAGALLVGDSVRGSLRDLVLERLGNTDQVLVSGGFFREQLAIDLRADERFAPRFAGICPVVAVRGFVTDQASGRRVGRVQVYGVDDRFWRFHDVAGLSGPTGRDALVSPALANELGVKPGSTILARMQRPSVVPLESLHGRKDDLGRTVRLTVTAIIPPHSLGEFSLDARQGAVMALFVPLDRLQADLDIPGRVNTLLVSSLPGTTDGASALEQMVKARAELEDVGLRLDRLASRHAIVIGAEGGLLDDVQVDAVQRALQGTDLLPQGVFTYLANNMRVGDREVPYSLVTATDLERIVPGVATGNASPPPIILNDWAAGQLGAAAGDSLTLDYYVWEEPGRLSTRATEFRVAAVTPLDPADRDLAPVYPGISDSPTLDDWNPPFPVDLRRVRPVDEEYWKNYRTTPKAFVPLEIGQQLWRSRYGAQTSTRVAVPAGQSLEQVSLDVSWRLRAAIDPLSAGLAVRDVRTESLGASRGATDFGEYFVYFSFFLVVSALLLAALFFKLSVEQRAREVGLLRAVGFGPAAVRRLFLAEGFVLSLAGSVIGVAGGIAYASLMMAGLRTWWVDAVGTSALALHVSAASLATGAIGGMVAAMLCILVTLRSLGRVSERSLLAGQLSIDAPTPEHAGGGGSYLTAAKGLAVIGFALMAGAAGGVVGTTGAFFAGGSALLAACICLAAFSLRMRNRRPIDGRGWIPVGRLGARNATYRPGRSVLAIAVVAAATFILISVEAFRRDDRANATDRHSGLGGYSLLVESLLPIVFDPNASDGRQTLGLEGLDSVRIEPFRVLEGDDASCLNLYEPKRPRIIAARESFLTENRFRFQASLATTPVERANPWLLLNRTEADGAIPVIADANSMTYVLHRSVGEEIVTTSGNRPIRLRLVAALGDSIFQGALVMSEARFRDLFPEQAGYQLLLVETADDAGGAAATAKTGMAAARVEGVDATSAETVAVRMEEALTDFGADATSTAARLAEFHKVENTYLSTFQTLGGLGLLLGTVGLAAVLLRNVLERRRELALLRALGYTPAHFFGMVMAENVLLLMSGLVAGTACALLAIAPVVWERGGRLPALSLGLLLGGVLAAGLTASAGATAAALRSPLLSGLRDE